VGQPCQLRPLRASPWTSACALAHVAGFLGHDARPRTQPSSYSPASAPHTPLTSFRTLSPSLALCSRRKPPTAAEEPRSRPWLSSSLESAPSLTELRPKVRHPSPCPTSLIAPCVRPILPSPVLDRGGPSCSRGGRTFWPGLVHRNSSLCRPYLCRS
jgi:hypothetical protein